MPSPRLANQQFVRRAGCISHFAYVYMLTHHGHSPRQTLRGPGQEAALCWRILSAKFSYNGRDPMILNTLMLPAVRSRPEFDSTLATHVDASLLDGPALGPVPSRSIVRLDMVTRHIQQCFQEYVMLARRMTDDKLRIALTIPFQPLRSSRYRVLCIVRDHVS